MLYSSLLPNKGVSFIFEDTDLLDLAVWAEYLLEGLFGRSLCQVPAIDGAIGGRRLAKDFIIGQRFGTGCAVKTHKGKRERKKDTK